MEWITASQPTIKMLQKEGKVPSFALLMRLVEQMKVGLIPWLIILRD